MVTNEGLCTRNTPNFGDFPATPVSTQQSFTESLAPSGAVAYEQARSLSVEEGHFIICMDNHFVTAPFGLTYLLSLIIDDYNNSRVDQSGGSIDTIAWRIWLPYLFWLLNITIINYFH